MPEKQPSNKKYRVYIEVSDDWLNANSQGGSRFVLAAEEEIKRQKELYRYRFYLFILFVLMALPLNLIFFAWVYCTEELVDRTMIVEAIAFYILARYWDIDKHLLGDLFSIPSYFKGF